MLQVVCAVVPTTLDMEDGADRLRKPSSHPGLVSANRVDAEPALPGKALGLRSLGPSRTLNNECCSPFSTVGDLRDFVRSHLGNPELSFYLCKSLLLSCPLPPSGTDPLSLLLVCKV